jgi:hypothetical protein
MKLLKKEYYYKTDNGFHFRRIETGKDQYTWWQFYDDNQMWEKIESERLIDRLESKHKDAIGR